MRDGCVRVRLVCAGRLCERFVRAERLCESYPCVRDGFLSVTPVRAGRFRVIFYA